MALVDSTTPRAALRADDLQVALEFCALIVRCEGPEGVVRVHGGRSRRPRGLHAHLGRGVRIALELDLRAHPSAEYELGTGVLAAHLLRHVYYPGPRTLDLPPGLDSGEVTPLNPLRGESLGVIRSGASERLGAMANRAARFEDVLRFQRRGKKVQVGLHCPLPEQAGHPVRLSEQIVSDFTPSVPTESFAVPWQVALGLGVVGSPVSVIPTEDSVGFRGSRGLILAPFVALNVR